MNGIRVETDLFEHRELKPQFEMYASQRWRMWFSLRFWRFRTPTQSGYDKLALRVAGLLPEVELALRKGKLGPRMRKIVSLPRALLFCLLPSRGAAHSSKRVFLLNGSVG